MRVPVSQGYEFYNALKQQGVPVRMLVLPRQPHGPNEPKMLLKVMVPAALPYMFTGFRLSLGIAWLVIVASEMLTGAPGVGGFLWQEYNSLIYEHLILCIITIGVVGYLLDRLMSVVEARFRMA